MKHANTAVIIPVYNEATVLRPVLAEILSKFSQVICVDDGSSDESAAVAEQCGALVVRHPINLGAGAATQTGIDYALQSATYRYFVTIDADGQHDVHDAVRMLACLKQHQLDIVLGSRFMGEAENISYIKRQFLNLAAVFSQITTGVKLTDPHIGLRVFNRKFAENLRLTLPDFTHASEIVHRIGEADYKYAEIPIKVVYTDYTKHKGQPMLNSVNIVTDLIINRISKK